jgi:ADP-ribose pyrophosphatase YjhB (NUDIX family)
MVDEDWLARPAPPQQAGPELRVAAVVPLPSDLGGSGEVLVLSAFGSLKLPNGEIRQGESIQRAVRRVALATAGAHVIPERLLYVVETSGRQVTLCILCGLDLSVEPETKEGARFLPISVESDLEPSAAKELLVEDSRGGFVRPTAWVVSAFTDEGRPSVEVIW